MNRGWQVGLVSLAVVGWSGCCEIAPEFCEAAVELGLIVEEPTLDDLVGEVNDDVTPEPEPEFPIDDEALGQAIEASGGTQIVDRFVGGEPFFEIRDANGNTITVLDRQGNEALFADDVFFDDGDNAAEIANNIPETFEVDAAALIAGLEREGGSSFRERFLNGEPFFEVLDENGNSLGVILSRFGNRAGFADGVLFDDGDDAGAIVNGTSTDDTDDAGDDGQNDDTADTGDDNQGDNTGDDGQDSGGDEGEVVVEKTVPISSTLAADVGQDSSDPDDCDPFSYLLFSCDFDVPAGGTVKIEIESDEPDSRPNLIFDGDDFEGEEVICGGDANKTSDRINVDEDESGSFFVVVSDAGTIASEYRIKVTILED